ncbi:glycosyltransferase [Algirhabdus cladophorae]|uniref:glycosyltransferase n=1 Tax=Algirhabdus cladophorae TaxID=3377108 RepID=UPI003B84AD61
MACYNGGRFLPAQLASFADQSVSNWILWASDDGSTDNTLAILKDFQTERSDGKMRLLSGPQDGAAMNFLSMLYHPELPDQPCALADHDDVWLPQKLAHILPLIDVPQPVLYAGRTLVSDANLEHQRPSKPLSPAPSFENALIQNRAAGNTIVLNQAALRALRNIGAPDQIAHHDWWLYQIMTGIGARVIFDETPLVIYRQHGTNVLGANEGSMQTLRRMIQLMGQDWRGWANVQHKALQAARHHLTPQNQHILDTWRAAPKAGISRGRVFKQLGLHRHKPAQTSLMVFLAILGRI